MPKLHQCNTCRYCTHHYALVCALHPDGVEGNVCADYEVDPTLEGECFIDFLGLGVPAEIDGIINNPWCPDPEENWAPDGWMYVNGELRRQELPLRTGEDKSPTA